MSRKKSMIEVKAPDIIIPTRTNVVGITAKELLTSNGHTCSYCKGNGWFWGEDSRGESTKTDCPVCKGSGMLDAMITVEWRNHPKD